MSLFIVRRWQCCGLGGVRDVGLLFMFLRTKNKKSCSFLVVVMTVFTVVCFFVVHPRGGGRGRVTGFHGGLRINRRIVATNNVCKGVGRVRSGAIILRVTSNIGVGVSEGSVFTGTTSGRRRTGWVA